MPATIDFPQHVQQVNLSIFVAQTHIMRMNNAWIAGFAAIIFTACGGGDDSRQQLTDSTKHEEEVKKPEPLAYDTLLTATSEFIAGMPVSAYLSELQSKDYYETHKKFTDDSWTTTQDSMLTPIAEWCKENNIGDNQDSTLCFYPLSGPDYMFANAFFPHADNYILLGLEPRGTMVDFRDLNDEQVQKYLSGIRASMKYINSRGYFVTSHMSSDFTKYHLNGMVHMILYMMARTSHPIVDVYHVYLDENGKENRIDGNPDPKDNKIYAIKIEFLTSDRLKKKALYYFKLDASDDNLNNHPEFEQFVTGFGRRVAYMKSASCVLQNTPFSIMRKLVLGADKILQDDTGVPYRYFVEDSTFNISLYGTYSTTIKDLNWCLQPQLKKDLAASPHHKSLPFKISYNGNYGEGMMIWAEKKKE